MLSEKVSYFIIAFSIYLLGKSIIFFHSLPLYSVLFDIFMAISLLCSNIPRVLPIKLEYLYYMKKIEYGTLGLALLMFAVLIIR
ncbi:hypothetical protein [Anaerosinus massiliensis]|uniref:hypothetical protein n=1 Tax=Massilibacillus massiliensis TaxID=1806837 RepID=UPI000DA60334|nr:hypothetical protein [Massilibacillus massiliensis]